MSDEQTEEERMSPEEYAKARDAAMKHLKTELPHLKVELQYETLLADIEEAKARRIGMVIQQARMMAPPPEAPPEGESMPGEPAPQDAGPKATQPKRKLKSQS